MKNKNSEQLINFCYNVKYLRTQHNLSKRDMAESLNISVYSLNKIERLQIPCRLSLDTVFTVCKHFGVSASDLFKERF